MFLSIGASVGYGGGLWDVELYNEPYEWHFYGWHCVWLGAWLNTFAVLWYGCMMAFVYEHPGVALALRFERFGASYFVGCATAFVSLVCLAIGLKWHPSLIRERVEEAFLAEQWKLLWHGKEIVIPDAAYKVDEVNTRLLFSS